MLNSSVKRKYGDDVSSKKWNNQFKEVKLKFFLNNLDIDVKEIYGFIRGFLQSTSNQKVMQPLFCSFEVSLCSSAEKSGSKTYSTTDVQLLSSFSVQIRVVDNCQYLLKA